MTIAFGADSTTRRNLSSARLRSVTSRKIRTAPSTFPSASLIGAPLRHHARAAKFDVEPAFRRGIRSRRDERKTVPGRTKRGAAEQLETPRPSRGLLQTVL